MENVLSIVPPYATDSPPLGAASLLGYLKANGHVNFDFLDLRLHAQRTYSPTFRVIGTSNQSYVVDVPDLPIILSIVNYFESSLSFSNALFHDVFYNYCVERGIDAAHLTNYLTELYSFLTKAAKKFEKTRFVGFSVWSSNFFSTLLFAAILKKNNRNIFIVAGGPQVTESINSSKIALSSNLFDAVVLGDGEVPLLQLFNEYLKPNSLRNFSEIKGLMYFNKTTKEFVINRQVSLIRMNDLPEPAFEKINISAYQPEKTTRSIPMQLTRGCTDKCSFCSEWVFWNRFRQLSPVKAMDHIEYLIHTHGANHIRMMDSLLNGNMRRLNQLLDLMLEKKYAISWSGFMRADMDESTAKKLHLTGFKHAFIGIESMNDLTLKEMNKRRTVNDNINALLHFLENDISINVGLIAGFPTDTPEAFKSTIEYFSQLKNKYKHLNISVEPFTLSPNQPIYKNIESHELIPKKFNDKILNINKKYRFITEDIIESISGPNQSLRQKLVSFANEKSPKAFIWSENDHLSKGYFTVSISNGLRLVTFFNHAELETALLVNESELDQLKNNTSGSSMLSTIASLHISYYSNAESFPNAVVARNYNGKITIGSAINKNFIEMDGELEAQVRQIIGVEKDNNGMHSELQDQIKTELKTREIIL